MASDLIKLLQSNQRDIADLDLFQKQLDQSSAADLVATAAPGQSYEGLTVLQLACSQGYTRHVQAIIDRAMHTQNLDEVINARASSENHKAWTPVFFAVVSGPNGHPDIVSILLKAGASFNARDQLGKTVLHYASEFGQDDTIEALLQNGADPNTQELDTKKTPLHTAIENGQFNSVQLLHTLSKQPLNLNTWDADGQSVLHYAAVTQGNAALYIRFFVEKCSMNVFVKNRQGQTAREYAQRLDRFKFHRVIKLLRELEQQYMNKKIVAEEKAEKPTEQAAETWIEKLMQNQLLSVLIGALIGLLFFLIDVALRGTVKGLEAEL